MQKILSIITGLILFFNTIPCFSAEEEISKIDSCRNAWCQAFDSADQELYEVLENLMNQNNKNTSELAESFPQIIRTYRCHLYWICGGANQFAGKTGEEKNSTLQNANKIFINRFGCQTMSLQDIKTKFNNAPLENCAFTYTTTELQSLRNECIMHADFKIEQLKIVMPHLLRKDANRKKMGFLAFKLTDLTERLEKFLVEDVVDLKNKVVDILENIECIVDKCN